MNLKTILKYLLTIIIGIIMGTILYKNVDQDLILISGN